MKTLLSLSLLIFGSTAFAALPAGDFTGFASSNSFNEWCTVNQAEVQFLGSDTNGYQLIWEEHGNASHGGFCDNYFDANLSATSEANVYDVNFSFNNDLIFGKATVNGNRIEITADYSGMNTGFSDFRATFIVDEAHGSMNYSRRIESDFGPSNWATGFLYR
jgi:hypothetical protein